MIMQWVAPNLDEVYQTAKWCLDYISCSVMHSGSREKWGASEVSSAVSLTSSI